MRKMKILSVILSLVLTISAFGAFSVFAKDMKPAGPESSESGETPTVDVSGAATEWKQYVSFGEEEALTPAYKAEDVEKLWEETNGKQIDVYAHYQGEGYLFVNTVTETEAVVDLEAVELIPELVKRETAIAWYNAETLEKVKEFTQVEVEFGGKVYEEYTKADQVEYRFDIVNGVLLVAKRTFVAVEDTDPVEYEMQTECAAFLKDGTLLGEEWFAQLPEFNTPDNASQHVEVTVGETVYVLKAGEVIATFKKGLQHDIPCYDNANGVWFTQGDYTYFVNELPMQPIGVTGDLVLVVFPGVTIQVMDKNFNVVANYETTGDSVLGYGVLSNGNIVVSEMDYVHKDATDFDLKVQEEKVKIKNSIISVANGSVTALSSDFILQNVFTNATKDIATPMHLNTMSMVTGHAQVAEGFFLAEMQKVVDGELSRDKSFVVMNNDGTLKAELPTLAANQFGYMGYFNKETPVFATLSVGNVLRFYRVEKTGKVSLFFNLADRDVAEIQQVTDDLLVYQDAIYMVNGGMAQDLSTYDRFEVHEDTVIAYRATDYTNAYNVVIYTESEDTFESFVNYKYLDGERSGDEIEYVEEGGVYVVNNFTFGEGLKAVINKYGETVLSEGIVYANLTTYDDEGAPVYYDQSLELVEYYVFGDTVVVHCRNEYEVFSHYGTGLYELPQETDVYYVLK